MEKVNRDVVARKVIHCRSPTLFWPHRSDDTGQHDTTYYLSIYAALSFTNVLLITAAVVLLALYALDASRSMHLGPPVGSNSTALRKLTFLSFSSKLIIDF